MEAGSFLQEWLYEEINNEQDLPKKAIKNSIQTNENILLPMVSKLIIKKMTNISQVTKH